MRRFEFSMGGSDKFWEVDIVGNDLVVRFGRMGTNGQTQTKNFASAAAVQKEHDKLIAEKLKKGYVEITSFAPPASGSSSTSSAPAKKGGRSALAVKKVLAQAGVDVSTFERVSVGEDDEDDEDGGKKRSDSDGSFYMVEVSKEIAMDVWRAVRNETDNTGYWPIFTEDHYDLFEFMEWDEGEDPALILKEAGSIQAPGWFQAHLEEDPSRYSEASEAERTDSKGKGIDEYWKPNSKQSNIDGADGFYVIENIGDGTSTMILVPTKTPWHAAAVLNWGNSNDGISPAEHTAMHKYWFTKYGAEPVSVTNAIWEFRVVKPPEDRAEAIALAREQFIYCPDIVHQGCSTLTGLASELIYSPRWYFWWD